MNSPGRDNGDHSFGSFGEPDGDGIDSGFPEVVVPDDISALDAEVRAYRREVARAQARARRRHALTAPVRALARFGRWLGRMCRYVLPW
ncbi:hypothetical protein [Catenulispora subtropica]|uniref:Uncharacterized protein n=1 Tax=Catenulispora subtropica TaxID=450798 RepID=A0ABP5DHV1_9ACTN